MPFAGYKNFDDCVKKNQDKRDPKAYCATIQRQVEGKMKFKRFIPITKVDEDQRMVFGFASTPDLDSDGEIVDLEALKKSLPEYMEFPTIREMHQPKAVGTTKHAEIVSDEKKGRGLFIGAKIVADEAWKLVKEGVLKGFSIGGNIIEKVDNIITSLDLVEISLVDVPANKSAVIELWKKETTKDENVIKIANSLALLTKDANTVLMLSGLLAHLKDVQFTFEMRKKKTTSIIRMIEQVKKLIAEEAQEKEPKPVKRSAGTNKMNEALVKIHKHQKEVNKSL